jgi:lipopolysaccharide transport system permease protein
VAIGWSLRSFAALPTSLLLMVVMHACYGAGVVAGLLSAGPEPPTRNSPVHTWNMLLILVKRQLRLLRKRSVLGLLWPLLAPWVMLILYSFVFHSVLNVPIPRYGVFLFAGLLPWSFLSTALGTAITSLSSEADLIRRRRFPYALLPLAVVIAASVYFLIALLGFIGYLGVRGQLHWATLPAILLPILSLYFFVGAASCVLATIDIYNRDLRQMLANILTVWFFLVPIVYQQRALTHRLLFLRSVDPANLIVGEFRDILYNGQILQPLHGVIVLFATTALLAFATSLVKRVSSSLPKDV